MNSIYPDPIPDARLAEFANTMVIVIVLFVICLVIYDHFYGD